MSSWVISRPRYLNSAIASSMNQPFLERKGWSRIHRMFEDLYFGAFTRRHMGAARTRDRSPAAISNWAS